MGLSMAGNLVKSGFVVKGCDLSDDTLAKAKGMVSINDCFKYIFLYYREFIQQKLLLKLLLMLILLSQVFQELQMLKKF